MGTADPRAELTSRLTATLREGRWDAVRLRDMANEYGTKATLALVESRAGVAQRDVAAYVESEYGFGPALAVATLDTLALETRGGSSARGGDLGALGDDAPAGKAAAKAVIDRVVEALGRRRRTTFGRQRAAGATADGTVDAAAVQALEDRLLGKDGALFKSARAMITALGHDAARNSEGRPLSIGCGGSGGWRSF